MACAQGYDAGSNAELLRDRSGLQSGQAGAAGVPAPPVASRPQAGAASAPYTGEPCRMGETAPCACGPDSDGMKICRFDRASPTTGTFSGCENCSVRTPVDDPGDVTARAGAGGASGRGGTGGAASGAGGSAGSQGEGASGGGSGPSRSGGSSCMPACTNICFPVGILPCCTLLGTCGCTWAPGAYCL